VAEDRPGAVRNHLSHFSGENAVSFTRKRIRKVMTEAVIT
jgi:hypothetical protein